MGQVIRKDSRVTVRGQGDGVVLYKSGPNYFVQLERGKQIACSRFELEPIEEPEPAFQGQPNVRRQKPGVTRNGPLHRPATAEDAARRSIEALRFGLVPDEALEDVTLQYEELADWISERLPEYHQDGATVSEVIGAYGAGKSHAMAMVRHVARQLGYMTARVEVDGRSITLADPESFLYALWSSLRLPDGRPTELIDQYISAIQTTRFTPRVAPRGVDRIAHNYEIIRCLMNNRRLDECRYAVNAVLSSSPEFTAAQVSQILYKDGWLTHPYAKIFRMVGKKLDERTYDFLESLIGHTLITRYAGWKGLVITIDEFEVERACLDPKMFSRAADLFNLLKSYLMGKLDHREVPLALFFATASKGSHGDQLVDELIEDCDGEYFNLHPFDHEDLRELANAIFNLYSRAYGMVEPLNPELIDRALKSLQSQENMTREFIRRYLYVLDAAYGPPVATLL